MPLPANAEAVRTLKALGLTPAADPELAAALRAAFKEIVAELHARPARRPATRRTLSAYEIRRAIGHAIMAYDTAHGQGRLAEARGAALVLRALLE